MTDTYHGIEYPSYWSALDIHKQRAWKAGVLAALAHLGADEARELAADLERTNGKLIKIDRATQSNGRLAVYDVLRNQAVHVTQICSNRLRPDIAIAIADQVIAVLVAKGWGDLSAARIDLASAKIAYQDALVEHSAVIAECNETIKRITGGRS